MFNIFKDRRGSILFFFLLKFVALFYFYIPFKFLQTNSPNILWEIRFVFHLHVETIDLWNKQARTGDRGCAGASGFTRQCQQHKNEKLYIDMSCNINFQTRLNVLNICGENEITNFPGELWLVQLQCWLIPSDPKDFQCKTITANLHLCNCCNHCHCSGWNSRTTPLNRWSRNTKYGSVSTTFLSQRSRSNILDFFLCSLPKRFQVKKTFCT